MIGGLLAGLAALIGRLSLSTVQRLGARVGLFFHSFLPIRRGEVRAAIRERLGVDSTGARRLTRELYRHLGTSLFEFLWMGSQEPSSLARIVRRDGWEHYRAARARGRGVVVVTGHVGNWDLCACSQAALGEPLHVVTKRLSARGLDAYWTERRAAMGVQFHGMRGSFPELLAALRRGESVAIIIDQRADEGGIDVPFLGCDARTSTAAALLARRAQAPLLPAFMTRDPDGLHTLQIAPAIDVDRFLPVREAVRGATLACNQALERVVRAHPEQWLWLHRRWKRAPS